jgi:hypothetical protein
MKKSRYTEGQIIGILKQHEAGVKTADLCREHGISAATFYGCDLPPRINTFLPGYVKLKRPVLSECVQAQVDRAEARLLSRGGEMRHCSADLRWGQGYC